MKFGKIIREQMKGVMTQESNTVDRTKKISWGYGIVGAIIMILDLAISSVRRDLIKPKDVWKASLRV